MSTIDPSELAASLRRDVLEMISRAGSSHIGTNYSMIELLAVLYTRVLRVRPDEPEWAERDRFVLSKGHGCAALYAVLAERGFFPKEWLEEFYVNGGRLAGHAVHRGVPGVEVSTGSLGHGLSIAAGFALAARMDHSPSRTICLLSDGECDEGSTWEAVLFAGHHKLSGLAAIVDYNKIQSLGRTEDVLDLEPFADKWRACRWEVREIDGHDVAQIEDALAPASGGAPLCVIAHTTKGKGVSFMEDDLLWHYRTPRDAELEEARKQLAEATVLGLGR